MICVSRGQHYKTLVAKMFCRKFLFCLAEKSTSGNYKIPSCLAHWKSSRIFFLDFFLKKVNKSVVLIHSTKDIKRKKSMNYEFFGLFDSDCRTVSWFFFFADIFFSFPALPDSQVVIRLCGAKATETSGYKVSPGAGDFFKNNILKLVTKQRNLNWHPFPGVTLA